MPDPLHDNSMDAAPRHQVASYLIRQVEEGKLSTGDKLPSRDALARKFGVSSRTVSSALRMLTASGLVEHVPGKGVFVAERPEDEEAVLRRAPARTIAVIGWYAAHAEVGTRVRPGVGYGEGILNAIALYAHKAGMHVLLVPGTEKEPLDLQPLLDCQPSCVISLGIELRPETVLGLRRVGIPLVVGNRQLVHLGVSYVDFDTAGCFARAAQIFYEHGHRRIATITNDFRTRPIGVQCREAFFLKLAECGLGYPFRDYYREFPSDHGSASKESGEYQIEMARRICREMLDFAEPPTAFYTHSRLHADGILGALHERGLRPGADVSLLTDRWGDEAEELSYFIGDVEKVGKAMIDVVNTLLADPCDVRQIDVPKTFVDRGSILALDPPGYLPDEAGVAKVAGDRL